MVKTRLATLLSLLILLVAVTASGCGSDSSTAADTGATTAATPEPERDAMAQTDQVQGAPGREMVLSKVTVPPGAQLALHHHEGTQIARIEAGVLTYTVREGSVVVSEGQSDDEPKTVRTIESGETAEIETGQWIVEQPSTIHRAANKGDEPVVIQIATLLVRGAPPATPVDPEK